MDQPAVLLVHTEYGTSKVGSSSLNRKVAEIIKESEPDVPVFSTVLQASEEDKKDAQQDGVELLLPRLDPDDPRTDPTPDWLTFDHRCKYPDLPSNVRSIVGHAGVTSRAALNMKDDRCPEAKVLIICSDISDETHENKMVGTTKKEHSTLQYAPDVVFSIGNKIFDHCKNQFRALPDDKQPNHFEFLPRPSQIFERKKVSYTDTEKMVVLSIGRVNSVDNLKGHDLAVKAVDIVGTKRNVECRIRGINEDSMNILQTHLRTTNLKPTILPYGTLTDLHDDMLKAHLVLIPSEVEPFELVGLDAVAAGIPVLMSDKSGLADFMKKISKEFYHSTVPMEGNEEYNVKQWARCIEQVLSNCEAEFERAARCRDKLLSAKYWEKSHQQFIDSCLQTGAQHPSEVQRESATAPARENNIRGALIPDKALQPSQDHGDKITETEDHVETEMGITETSDQGTVVYETSSQPGGGPPLLPVVVEILEQVLPSVETPDDMLNFAFALETLSKVNVDSALPNTMLEQIKSRTRSITDLLTVVKAVKKLERFKGIKVSSVKTGSLIFYLQCTDMDGLGNLWFMYKSGKLNDLLVGSLISEETLQQLCAETITVKTTIHIEDFRKALVYLLTIPAAKGEHKPGLSQEYPLYQPHIHTNSNVLDVLHLEETNLAYPPKEQHYLEIPLLTQEEDSLGDLVNLQYAVPNLGFIGTEPEDTDNTAEDIEVQEISSVFTSAEASVTQESDVPLEISELVSLDIRDLEQLMKQPRRLRRSSSAGSSGHTPGTSGSTSSRPYTPTTTTELETQGMLRTLLAELNAPTVTVMKVKVQQFDLYCQIGDLYRTKLHNLQAALQYYQYMLECSKELSEDTKQAKAYNRLGLTCDMLGLQAEAFANHKKALAIYGVEARNETDICVAYKNLASSLALPGHASDAKTNYESALTVAMETGNKTEQMDIYCKLGDLHRKQLHEPQVSHKYYTEMLALSMDLGRKGMEGMAFNKMGLACGAMKDYEAALEWHQKFLKMRQESGDKTEQKTAHKNIADSYKALGKVDLARSHYAMTIAMETGNKAEQIDIYCKLGDLHREQLHEPKVSHKYYTDMLALARDLERKDKEGLAYNRLGLACYGMHDYEAALEWHQKHLKMSQESVNKTEQITAHQNIAVSHRALGKLDLARSHYHSAMDIAMETGNKTEQMDIYRILGDLHREQLHEPKVSHKYYTEMLALARDLGRKEDERLAYNRLGLACYGMHDYEAALEWHQQDLKISQDDRHKTEQVIAHKNTAASYKAMGKLDLARSHYQSAMDIAMETEDKHQQENIAESLSNLLQVPQRSLTTMVQNCTIL